MIGLPFQHLNLSTFKSIFNKGSIVDLVIIAFEIDKHTRDIRDTRVFQGYSQPAFTCSKSAMQTPGQYVCEICLKRKMKTPERRH